ncbi:MAG TPA: hypothetical protein VL068_13655, partial [Microthrixaceae bacterium]|nr:hypothetical protein [Microthrixaceae bacterium]
MATLVVSGGINLATSGSSAGWVIVAVASFVTLVLTLAPGGASATKTRFTLIIATLAIACAAVVIVSMSSGSSDDSTSVESAAPDPDLYFSRRTAFVPRELECDGLLGICLGQPISLAIETFGTIEEAGFPQSVSASPYQLEGQCHRWNLAAYGVDVCEHKGSVSQIALFFTDTLEGVIALPQNGFLRLPDSLAGATAAIDRSLPVSDPSRSLLVGEGETVAALTWKLPSPISPDSEMTLVGRTTSMVGQDMVCDPTTVSNTLETVGVSQISVAMSPPEDFDS